MPSRSPGGQPADHPDRRGAWFASGPGRALLDSETDSIQRALDERPGRAWLWLSPHGPAPDPPSGRGLRLQLAFDGWQGPIRCALPFPLATESVATVVVQHVARTGRRGAALIEECARVLVPGGRLWLYALNPVSPYRWRWNAGLNGGWRLGASEPMPWRRRLREAGLQPDAVSQGLGPRWRVEVSPALQSGPGLRAAYVLSAEKRTVPLTPLRSRPTLLLEGGLGDSVPAA